MSRQSLLAEAQAAFDDLMSTVSSLDEAAMSTTAFGEWNLKQLLAHIGGWQRVNAEMMERMARGEPPVLDGADYSDDDSMNASFAAAAAGQTGAEAIATARESLIRFTRAAEGLPEERFENGRSAMKMVQGNGTDHIREHLVEIREFVAGQT